MPDYLKDLYLEFTPIDSSASAILKIIKHTNAENIIYHLCNHNTVKINKLLEILKKQNIDIQIIDEIEFRNVINSILNGPNSIFANPLLNDLDLNLDLNYKSNIKIQSQHTVNLLKMYGFEWPIIDENYILNLIKLIKGSEKNAN